MAQQDPPDTHAKPNIPLPSHPLPPALRQQLARFVLGLHVFSLLHLKPSSVGTLISVSSLCLNDASLDPDQC